MWRRMHGNGAEAPSDFSGSKLYRFRRLTSKRLRHSRFGVRVVAESDVWQRKAKVEARELEKQQRIDARQQEHRASVAKETQLEAQKTVPAIPTVTFHSKTI